MADYGLIRNVVAQGVALESSNAEIFRKNLAAARNKVNKDWNKDPSLVGKKEYAKVLEQYLAEAKSQTLEQVNIGNALRQGTQDGKIFVSDSAGIPNESTFWGWTPSIPVNAISLAESEMAALIQKAHDSLKEKILRSVQVGLASGESIAEIQKQILGTGLSGLKGKDGIWRSATSRAETQARSITNDLVNRGAMMTYSQVDKLAPELNIKKIWQTVSDRRTSNRCESLRGQIRELNDLFQAKDGWKGMYPPGHPNCRSRVTCITEKYKKEWENRWGEGTAKKPVVVLPSLSTPMPVSSIAPVNLRAPLKPERVFSPDPEYTAEKWNELFSKMKSENPEFGERLDQLLEFKDKNKIRLFMQPESSVANPTTYLREVKEHIRGDIGLANNPNMRTILRMSDEQLRDNRLGVNRGVAGLSWEDRIPLIIVRTNDRATGLDTSYGALNRSVKETISRGTEFRKRATFNENEPLYGTGLPLNRVALTENEKRVQTYLHEMGHTVQMHGLRDRSLSVKAPFGREEIFTAYGSDMRKETFAEGFYWYMVDPQSMKATSPNYYNWVHNTWRSANGR